VRILFLSQQYPPETGGGGIGSYVSCIAPALAERGHNVHVLSCFGGQQERDYLDGRVHIHRRGVVRIRGLGRIFRWPDARNRLLLGLTNYYWQRRLGEFDIIEYPDWMAEGLAFALLRRTPTVGHLHTGLALTASYSGWRLNRDLRWADKLEQFSILRATKLTSPSQHLVDELRSNDWIRDSQVEVIPYPLEWRNWCQVTPVAATDPVIAYIGRFEPLKRPEMLIAAAKLLAGEMPDIRIVFIGRNNAKHGNVSYLDWIKEQAADHFYEFIDQVPRSALPELLGRIRIFVAPSIFESFHLGAAEAMASGRPVIVTKGAGIAEVIDGHDVGRVVAPDDPVALAAALRPFLTSAPYASEVGARACSLIRCVCDPERIAERRERLYINAIAEHRRRDSP